MPISWYWFGVVIGRGLRGVESKKEGSCGKESEFVARALGNGWLSTSADPVFLQQPQPHHNPNDSNRHQLCVSPLQRVAELQQISYIGLWTRTLGLIEIK